jgi:glycosyltransferase involved in cell wall biosynthesis
MDHLYSKVEDVNMNEPLISIIVPVYNVALYIGECIDSCLNQTYTNIEIVAIDDGSTDESGSILDAYAAKDKRLCVVHQENKGVVLAREEALRRAHGEYVSFVDGDDLLYPNAIEVLFNAMVQRGVDISVGQYCEMFENGKIRTARDCASTTINGSCLLASMLLTEKISFSLCGKIYSMKLFEDISHEHSIKIGEDAYVTIQIFGKTNSVAVLSDIVYTYRQRNSSVTHNPNDVAINSILIFIECALSYYEKQEYYHTESFRHSINYFIMKEYFMYLRLGGKYYETALVQRINNECISDKIACGETPFWRILMFRFYKCNITLGNLFRFIIVFIRAIKRKCLSI